MSSEEFSCIKQVVKTVQLSLPLMFISNEIAGITGVLDSWKRQYVKQLQGIVVSYKNVSLTSRYGTVSTQRSYAIYNIKATFDLFCPNIGDIVKGKINRVSREHIGCLIQETINVNIHLPRNSHCGLSKYINLDREILFEITHFSCEPKVIRVTGDITPKCIELMNELFPVVEEGGSFGEENTSAFGDENNQNNREAVQVNLSILNSVKTSEEVKKEGKSKKSKKRKRESESSVLESAEESTDKETVKIEVKTPKKKKLKSLDVNVTDSPEKSPKKTKKIKIPDELLTDFPENSLDGEITDSLEKTPKKKKSKKKRDAIEDDIIKSLKKEVSSNLDTSMSDSSETIAINQALGNSEHFNLLTSIKNEVDSSQTDTKSSEEKNKKKRKREGTPTKEEKNKKKHKKKNKDGSKSKDKKNSSKKKSKVLASGTVLKKDKKKSKVKKLPKKDDKSKKSKKTGKKDKSEKRKSKKLKLSNDNDIKDVIKEIKAE